MEQKDLLEVLATAAVVDLARRLRGQHIEQQEKRAGQTLRDEQWPPIEDFYVEAAQLMNRRREQIIALLSQ